MNLRELNSGTKTTKPWLKPVVSSVTCGSIDADSIENQGTITTPFIKTSAINFNAVSESNISLRRLDDDRLNFINDTGTATVFVFGNGVPSSTSANCFVGVNGAPANSGGISHFYVDEQDIDD